MGDCVESLAEVEVDNIHVSLMEQILLEALLRHMGDREGI